VVTEESGFERRRRQTHTQRGAAFFFVVCVVVQSPEVVVLSLSHTQRSLHTVYAHTITKPVDAYCTIEYENIFEFTNDLITLA
jgi:hypothetical protein